MSASDKAIRGGQPSTTQPSAGPWLSPQVVTRNRWPKVLCDMAALLAVGRAQANRAGQGGGPSVWLKKACARSRAAACVGPCGTWSALHIGASAAGVQAA